MAIEVSCPGCGKILHLADHVAGKKGKCPACGVVMDIPSAGETPAPEGIFPPPPPTGYRPNDGAPGTYADDKNATLGDYVRFDRFITPLIFHVVFWLGLAGSYIWGIHEIYRATKRLGRYAEQGGDYTVPLLVFLFFLAYPIILRVYCEMIMLFFKALDTLKRIEENTTPRD